MEKNKRQVPRLRFPGFNDAWEQRKLGEILEINQIPVPKPSSSYIRLGIRSHGKGTFHEQVEAGSGLAVDTMFKVETDNLIINITFAWELALAVTDAEDDGKLVSHRFPQYKFKSQYSPTFFKNLIYDKKFKSDLMLASPGGAGRNRVLKKSEFLDIERTVPKQIEEQTAIGNFFKQLDAAIASHQRKLERVKELKKSLLQKMFPKDGEAFPELRFPNFTDAWEQRKLGELYKKNTERNELKFPIEKTISIAKMVFNPEGNGALSESLVNYRVLRVGDIAFEGHKNKDFLFGRFVLNDVGNGIMSPRFSSLRPIEYLNISFWKQYIHYEPIMRGILKNSTKLGTMMNELVIDDFLKQPIDVPTLKEQTAIGDFFRQLDAAIASHQRKPVLQKASKIKQADTISACFWLAKSSQMPHHNIGILIFKFLNNMNISVLRGGHARMPEPSRHAGNRYPGKKQ